MKNMKNMESKIVVSVFLTLFLLSAVTSTSLAIGEAHSFHQKNTSIHSIRTLANGLWYDSREKAIYIDTSKGSYYIDFGRPSDSIDYGTYRLVMHTEQLGMAWDFVYGDRVDIGTAFICQYGVTYQQALKIGTLKIDTTPLHFRWVSTDLTSEWFGVTLTKTDIPSDWIVVLHRSDGKNMLPITRTFWYSLDSVTWKSFKP